MGLLGLLHYIRVVVSSSIFFVVILIEFVSDKLLFVGVLSCCAVRLGVQLTIYYLRYLVRFGLHLYVQLYFVAFLRLEEFVWMDFGVRFFIISKALSDLICFHRSGRQVLEHRDKAGFSHQS